MATVKTTFTSDDNDVRRSLESQVRLTAKLRGENERLSRGTQKAGREQQGFLSSGLKGAISLVAAYGSVASIMGVVSSTFSKVIQKQKESANLIKESQRGIGSLGQLAEGDSQLLNSLVESAKQIFGAGGTKTLNEAGLLVFELKSAEDLRNIELFSKLGAVTDPAAAVRTSAKIRASFGERAGSTAEILSVVAGAASPATGVDVGQVGGGIVTAAPAALQLGVTFKELAAAISIASETAKSGEQGGTQIRALLNALVKQGFAEKFEGKSLEFQVAEIKGRGLTEKQVQKFLGGTEAAAGFAALSGRPGAFGERKGKVEKAADDLLINKVIATTLAQPLVSGPRAAQAAENRLALSRLDEGLVELKTAARFDVIEQKLVAAGAPEFTATLGIETAKAVTAGLDFVGLGNIKDRSSRSP